MITYVCNIKYHHKIKSLMILYSIKKSSNIMVDHNSSSDNGKLGRIGSFLAQCGSICKRNGSFLSQNGPFLVERYGLFGGCFLSQNGPFLARNGTVNLECFLTELSVSSMERCRL